MRVLIKDYVKSCLTRNRGKDLLCKLIVSDENEYFLDFSDIQHVSTSFLDESVWKLVEMGKIVKIYDPDEVVLQQLNLIKKWRQPAFKILEKTPYIEFAA
ncbi:MAG: DUF4325 domain-containing protein [Calditrichaceae bacterium]|nr:DUF4325 domain-containing protein [Calditrichaceae bacterium]MBN2709795.1 DUF4325 domain-containing protein [Calditrichaceae bacterium]RQV94989.1 MAG: hypothetical protein EH224_08935 [Calditrichota bacterium]